MVRPMVHSVKHYVQVSLSTVAASARNAESVARALESTVANSADEVPEGSSIKAVFMEMWVVGSANDTNFIATLLKLPGGLGTPSFSDMTDLFAYKNKKNILYTTQGIAQNDGVSSAIPIYRGWVKIPKSKQRFGLGDSLYFILATQGSGTLDYCGFFTYKEYS